MDTTIYDHSLAIDWSIQNITIARINKNSNKITIIYVPADLTELKLYLKKLEREKVMAIE